LHQFLSLFDFPLSFRSCLPLAVCFGTMPPDTALSATPVTAAVVSADIAVDDPSSLKSSCQIANDCGEMTKHVATFPTESFKKGEAMMALLEKSATCDGEGVALFNGDGAPGPVTPAILDAAVALSLSMKFGPASRSQKWLAYFTDGNEGKSTSCRRWDALRAMRRMLTCCCGCRVRPVGCLRVAVFHRWRRLEQHFFSSWVQQLAGV
jgi:hypothetical protein